MHANNGRRGTDSSASRRSAGLGRSEVESHNSFCADGSRLSAPDTTAIKRKFSLETMMNERAAAATGEGARKKTQQETK